MEASLPLLAALATTIALALWLKASAWLTEELRPLRASWHRRGRQ